MIPYGYKQTEIGVIPEDWDCVRLGEKAKIYRGGSPRPIQDYITTSSDGANWIKIGDVGENDKYIRSTQEKITPEGISKSREVHIGDFILSNSMSFGRPYILDIDGCIHDGWLTIQDYKNTFSTEYLYYLLASDLVYQQYIGMAAGSSVKNLNKDKVSALYVIYTAVSEQERIAEALSDVDELISSLEKLIEKYKSVKATCLQQMFPQKGETTPKMRLPGFTGAWEQRKLGELAIFNPKADLPDVFEYVDLESVVGTEMLSHRTESKRTAPSRAQRLAQTGDLFYQTVRPYQKNNYLFEKPDKHYVFSTGYTQMRPVVDGRFLLCLVQSDGFVKVVLDNCTGTSYPAINSNDLSEIEVYSPEDYQEQKQIGDFFKGVDNLITLHQRKLDKAKKIKQGMMQQLLTGKIRLVKKETITDITAEQDNLPKNKTGHNHQFDDAIMIAAIINSFYSEKYPLGRKKVQKLLYLLRRKQEANTSEFKKKAAGPYADEIRYKGGEPIAKKNGYISATTTQKGTSFSKGKKIDAALSYVEKWQMQSDIDWLVSNFKYVGVNDLELYATIDMAICDLRNEGVEISVDSVKELIRSNSEWKAKLKKAYFSDTDIERAIKMSYQLYP